MKRSLSQSDSDDDFDDDRLKSGSPSQSCHVTDRKKRRGVIEKRRRDRINTSLSELRRLVPSAFEKQGSAKLEKAEILQMTVDHLKMLHSKGINGYNFPDTHAVAGDYRGVGFRECATEVARYLMTVEGLDVQDPLRLRLLSHLQCFSSQQRLSSSAKSSFQNSSMNYMTATYPAINAANQYSSNGVAMTSMLPSHHSSQSDQLSMSTHNSHSGIPSVTFSESRLGHADSTMRIPTVTGQSAMSSMGSSSAQSVSPQSLLQQPMASQFPMLNMNSMMSPSGNPYHSAAQLNQLGSMKPYRPWGAEIVY